MLKPLLLLTFIISLICIPIVFAEYDGEIPTDPEVLSLLEIMNNNVNSNDVEGALASIEYLVLGYHDKIPEEMYYQLTVWQGELEEIYTTQKKKADLSDLSGSRLSSDRETIKAELCEDCIEFGKQYFIGQGKELLDVNILDIEMSCNDEVYKLGKNHMSKIPGLWLDFLRNTGKMNAPTLDEWIDKLITDKYTREAVNNQQPEEDPYLPKLLKDFTNFNDGSGANFVRNLK